MTDKFAEVKQTHAQQVADILAETHPTLTPGQVQRIQKECAEVITDWTLAPLVKSLNKMTVEGLLATMPELSRAVPTPSQVREHLLAKHREDFGEYVSGQKEMEIARQVAAMSDDERLAACPASAVAADQSAPSAVEALNAQAPRTMTAREIEDEEDRFLWRTFGLRPHQVDGHKRAEYLRHFHGTGPTHGQQQDAQRIDALNLKSGGDDEKLTTIERVNKFRAEQALKRRA